MEALIIEDWRDWVSAVKTEMDSWNTFEAAVSRGTLGKHGAWCVNHPVR